MEKQKIHHITRRTVLAINTRGKRISILRYRSLRIASGIQEDRIETLRIAEVGSSKESDC
jgi:hypothetical protein